MLGTPTWQVRPEPPVPAGTPMWASPTWQRPKPKITKSEGLDSSPRDYAGIADPRTDSTSIPISAEAQEHHPLGQIEIRLSRPNIDNTNSEKLIHTSPRDYVGAEESRIGSPTFISELVPTIATAGAYLSRSLNNTSPRDLTVVPETVCESQIRTQTHQIIPPNRYQRQPPWPKKKATITLSLMGKTN